jgi:hypothetical protein
MTPVFPHEDTAVDVSPERMDRRQQEITGWITHFVESCRVDGVEASFSADDVALLNADYWDLLKESVRPRVAKYDGGKGHIDRHKIASMFELLIVHHRPIKHTDEQIADDLNARFAFFVAINIIASWNGIAGADLYVSESFDREHRTWLKQLNMYSESWPIFSNAATWYLVELVYLERTGRT